MKKVLFIAYLYPPIVNSGTRRSLEFVNYLPDHNWNPIVLTVANPTTKFCDSELLDEVRSGTLVYRVPFWTDELAAGIGNALQYFFDRVRVTNGLKWRLRKLLSVPDECAGWWLTAVRKGVEIYSQEGFDAIYASGWPWTSFLVAKEISRRTGKPFVVDYRDLWKASEVEWDKRSLLQSLFNPYLEKVVLRDATAVITTTSFFAKTLRDSKCKGRVACITNGFDPDDFIHKSVFQPANSKDVVRIVYTGVWRSGYGPDDLYRAIKYLKDSNSECLTRLKVMVAGFSPGRAQEYGIEEIVDELGAVSHSQAIELTMRADALYLPVSQGFYEKASIPGKLFDYIGCGRPIVASVPQDSEVAAVLSTVGGAFFINPGDIQTLAQTLEKMCKKDGADLFSERIPSAVEQYTRGNLTEKLSAILDYVVENRE